MSIKNKLHFFILLCFIIFATTPLFANNLIHLKDDIDAYSNFQMQYFEDTSNMYLTIEQVKEKNFQTVSNAFSLGYSTNNFWFRMTVVNESEKSKEIYLELTEIIHKNVDLYIISSNGSLLHERNGLSIPVKERNVEVSRPTFSLQFEAGEKKELYIKLSSTNGIFGAIQLKTHHEFHHTYQFKEKLYIFYFGAIITIGLYNLFIFFFLREKIYLYYVYYVFVFVIWSANYKGILLANTSMEIYYLLQTTIPIFFILYIRFSQTLLETKKYFLNSHKILNIFIGILIFILIWMLIDIHPALYLMNIIATPILLILLFIAFLAFYKGDSIAKIYLLAITIYIISLNILGLLALGVIPYNIIFSNAPIIGSFFEIILLSLLLAYRINLLRQEKFNTQEKLLQQESTEGIRLSKMVKEKTSELSTLNDQLNIELESKKLLYQELNHRVKNNLLMILSLIKLQISRTAQPETKKELQVTKNRIHSLSNLYEYLHLHEMGKSIDTMSHFRNIIENIRQDNYEHIDVKYNITYNLNNDDLLYTGLILNELATNAFKYAFHSKGTLIVSLYKDSGKIYLIIEDNGTGFEKTENDSLGLTIVRTLVEDQLFGEMSIDSNNGTKITINWEENEKS